MNLSEQLLLNPSSNTWLCAVVLVSAALAGIASAAKGLNVRDVTTATFRNGYYMIGRQLDVITAALQAAVVVLLTKSLPFLSRIRAASGRFASAVSVSRGSFFIWIIGTPFSSTFFCLVLVFGKPFPTEFPHLVLVCNAIALVGFAYLALICGAVVSLGSLYLVQVLDPVFSNIFQCSILVFGIPFSSPFPHTWRTLPVPVPFIRATFLTRLAIICAHMKNPLAGVPARGSHVQSFSRGRLRRSCQALGCYKHRRGISFTPLIIPQIKGVT